MSQEEFAAVCDLHRTYISSLESGSRNPTLTTLHKISKALNLKISDLVEGIDE